MATCYMRMGDPAAARAPLEVGGSALLAHVDVAAKLAEVEAQSTRLTAVRLQSVMRLCPATAEFSSISLHCIPISRYKLTNLQDSLHPF